MPRYVTRPSANGWVDDCVIETPMLPSLEACDFEPTFTGLLDADGDEIWRAPNPIGFGRDEEW